MRGKVGLVIGLGVGYVLGTRAGRERYEQIKQQAEKVWNLPPVQNQVVKVQDAAKSALMALPTAVWNSAVKVTKAATQPTATPGERLDAALQEGRDSADDIAEAAEKSADAAVKSARDVKKRVSDAAPSPDDTDGK
jgi:hypothetical protein